MKTLNAPIGASVLLSTLFACSLLSPARAAVDVGQVQISSVGHSFAGSPATVSDFLIDQDQSSNGGGTLSTISVNWDTNFQFVLTISAPAGQKFLVQVPPGRSARFGGFLLWESTRGGNSPVGPATVSFSGLEGSPPDFSGSDAVLSASHGYFGFSEIVSTSFSNNFAFTSLIISGTVTPQITGNGAENYTLNRESSLQLFYDTLQTTDPGAFVFIVPAGQPTNSIVSLAEAWIRWAA
jgi:hypothetical protein